jgi:bifunctional DNA-binding transcriptional regulator/antitoxin component of YhaV-PrlF toxin-antitoxin module
MEVGLTRLDDKGRIVIPKRVRKAAGLFVNCSILIYGFERCVLLNRAGPGPEPPDEPAQALPPGRGKGMFGKPCGKGRRASAPHEKGEVTA